MSTAVAQIEDEDYERIVELATFTQNIPFPDCQLGQPERCLLSARLECPRDGDVYVDWLCGAQVVWCPKCGRELEPPQRCSRRHIEP